MNGEYVLSIAKDKVLAADNTKNEYLPAYNSGVIKVDVQDRPTIASVQKVHASQYKVKFSEPVKSLTGANFSAKYVADGTTLSVGTTDAEDIVLDTTDLQLKGELLVNLNTAVKSNKEIELKLVGAVDWNNNLLSPNPASIALTKGESDGKAPEVTDITVINPQKLEIKFSEEVVKFGTAAVDVSGNTVTKVEQDKNDKTKFIIELISPLLVGYVNVSIDADAIIDLYGEGIKAFSKAIQVKEDTEAPELTSAVIQKDGRDGYEYLVVKFNRDVNLDKFSNLYNNVLDGKEFKDYVTRDVKIKAKTVGKGFEAVDPDVKNEYRIKLDDLEVSYDGGTNYSALVKDAKYTLNLPAAAVENLTGKDNDAKDGAISFTRGSDSVVSGQEVVKVQTNLGATDGSAAHALGNNKVVVVFKEEVNGADATNTANYSIDGAVVKNAELAADKKTVTLTLEDNKTEYRGARYITISNVRTSGNVAMKESFRKVIELNENIAPTVKGVAVTSIVENTGDSTKYDVTVKLTFSENVWNDTSSDFGIFLNGTEAAGVTASVEAVASASAKQELTVTFTVSKSDFDDKKVELRAKSTIDVQDVKGNKLADNTVVTVK